MFCVSGESQVLKILLDFRTKPNYAPVIDLVNELSKKFSVFFIPNKRFHPAGLSNSVVCCRETDVHTIKPNVVFSTYSSLLIIAYLKARLKLPIVNYVFSYMLMKDVLSKKFLALPDSYKLWEIMNLMALSFPKSLLMPDRLIVPNIMIKKELALLGFHEDRMVVLPWGLNVDKYQSRAFSLMDPSTDSCDNVIVYTGPLHPLRFSMALIYSFSGILKQNGDARLLLLFRKDLWNHGLYKKLISAIRKLGLQKKVSIVIPTSHESYLSFVARSTVVVLPYFSSGIVEVPPLTLLECMALSKPVITTHGIATYGIIEDGVNGFVLSENNSSLTDIISFVIFNRKKAQDVGCKARIFVHDKFNLTKFSQNLSRILEICGS
jgi:glycosyltransferase involved in cell wall biosynthesis